MQRKTRETITGYLFASPWIIGFLAFIATPIFLSLYFSFCNYSILRPPQWVGLDNYKSLFFEDDLFRVCVYNTFYYVGISVFLGIIWALALALLVTQKLKGVIFFRAIYYLPAIMSGIPIAFLWQWVFNPRYGLINTFLDHLGITGPLWLLSETWVKPSFIIMSLWQVGRNMIIYLAALKGVPRQLYEAAELDGSGHLSNFWHITIPMISPAIFFTLILSTIESFQIFTNVYIMTEGGPANASLFYVLYLYRQAFEYFRMGYASTLAWILFVIILIFTFIQFKISGRWVYYESRG